MISKNILTIIILILSIFCNAQNGKIVGKLIVKNSEEKEYLPKNIYAFLKSKKINDSILLNENFEFQFENLKADTINLSFSVRNYPTNKYYIIRLNENQIYKADIWICPICPYKNSEEKYECPKCGKKDKVIPIVYGLISNVYFVNKKGQKTDKNGKIIKKKEKEYYAGGCVVSECQPNWYCGRDKTEF